VLPDDICRRKPCVTIVGTQKNQIRKQTGKTTVRSSLFLYCLESFFGVMYGFIKKRQYGLIRPISLERAETTKRVYDLELSRTKEFALSHRGIVL
jgi:hypothetical protein